MTKHRVSIPLIVSACILSILLACGSCALSLATRVERAEGRLRAIADDAKRLGAGREYVRARLRREGFVTSDQTEKGFSAPTIHVDIEWPGLACMERIRAYYRFHWDTFAEVDISKGEICL